MLLRRVSSVKGSLIIVLFHQILSSIKDSLPSYIVFNKRSSIDIKSISSPGVWHYTVHLDGLILFPSFRVVLTFRLILIFDLISIFSPMLSQSFAKETLNNKNLSRSLTGTYIFLTSVELLSDIFQTVSTTRHIFDNLQ